MQGPQKHRYNGASAQPLQDEAAKLRLLHQLCDELGVKIDAGDMTPWLKPSGQHREVFYATAAYPAYDRPMLIDGWLPMNETIGLSGPGGEGKTILAQMLATAAALGSEWLGLPVRQMKSCLVLNEDRMDDVLWRQQDIDQRYGSNLKTLAPWMKVFARRDAEDNYLAIFDRDDVMHETTWFHELLEDLILFAGDDPVLTILDTKSDVFRGKQNDEHHARIFIRRICDRIARKTNGGVCMLIYHPSIAGMREGTGSSGSVQWDAAFRARLYLASPDDKDANPLQRTLTLVKANHAQRDKTRDIQWDRGIFRLSEEIEAETPDYEHNAGKAASQHIFREMFDLFRSFTKQPLTAHAAPEKLAHLYAQQNPTKPIDKNTLKTAMWGLIHKGDFRLEETTHNRRKIEALVIAK